MAAVRTADSPHPEIDRPTAPFAYLRPMVTTAAEPLGSEGNAPAAQALLQQLSTKRKRG